LLSLLPFFILIDIVRVAAYCANDTAMGYWFNGNATALNNPGITDFRKYCMNILLGTTVLDLKVWATILLNITTGIVLLLSRFPSIGPLAIAGLCQ
jgi:K+-transporting ATPase ATPase A chain